jgi:predicted acylesterase/phospholipase RssA
MPEPKSATEEQSYSVQQDDAVCFSAGLTGAPFGAGTIHAYLASDRKPPIVAAGISLGALNAAVMERCYRDMEICRERGRPRTEAARWGWYRRYLTFLLDRPFDVVWDAVPDPSDLIADLPPVEEPNLPVDENGATIGLAKQLEIQSRRKLYIVAKLGSWLAHLPIRVSSIAWLTVRYVRARENYPRNILQIWNLLCLHCNLLWTLWRLLWHAARPFWVFERWFRFEKKQIRGHLPLRPLLGWGPFLTAVVLWSLALWFTIKNALWTSDEMSAGEKPHFRHLVGFAVLMVSPLLPVWFAVAYNLYREWRPRVPKATNGKPTLTDRLLGRLLANLDIERSLISDFPLLLKLFRLFEDKGHSPKLRDCKLPILLVAAPLQILPSKVGSHAGMHGGDGPNQLWPKPGGTLSIVRALRACLSVAPWFSPWPVPDPRDPNQESIADWVSDPTTVQHLDLVDGAAVRHNPLPALFRYLKDNPKVAAALNDRHARVHLIYDVPIRWKPETPQTSVDPDEPEPRLPDIVETGFNGIRLANRRDSRLEVIRTNFLSDIERNLRDATGSPTAPPVHIVKVNEIAPEDELRLKNQLNPTETELLTHIAAGCRRTLSVLYADEISPGTRCWEFLRKRANNRHWDEATAPGVPGLAEVCRHCTQTLDPPPPPPVKLLPDDFSAGDDGRLARTFPKLSGTEPRIVFLASGGVFRGSFHIGMLGAMLALNIKPHVIVGASVGTLMGAVLGSIFKAKAGVNGGDAAARIRLNKLANLFVDVDKLVALTKTFKAAAKDLGIRARSESLRLSPNDLRKMVKRGSREDAGIAATGAPPALIDAISDLFLIPYRKTTVIAADFVAGHFSKAIHAFLKQISTETIDRLGIYEAVLGANLIEREIRKLLKEDIPADDAPLLDRIQPFLRDSEIAFFATTVNLITERITTLGADLNCESYDVMEALLASSAFPAAFAPRRASALYPGTGRRDIFYGDGGMFDNLPALPAFEVLAEVQRDRLRPTLGHGKWRDELERRYREPDLILVGSLNVRQNPGLGHEYGSMLTASARATSLADNEKIHGLERASIKIDKILKDVRRRPKGAHVTVPAKTEEFLNGIVNAAVLPVYPSDELHLNGTFNFCASLGLDRDRVRRSIAGGCFQTMCTIREGRQEPESLTGRSLKATGIVQITKRTGESQKPVCPYFLAAGADIPCPFAEGADGIYSTCSKDQVHQEQHRNIPDSLRCAPRATPHTPGVT